MGSINSPILVAGTVIGLTGLLRAWANPNGDVGKVVVGTLAFVLLLALIDAISSPLSVLTDKLALLAMVYVLLTQFPWSIVSNALSNA